MKAYVIATLSSSGGQLASRVALVSSIPVFGEGNESAYIRACSPNLDDDLYGIPGV